jgi:hypothetical protein
LIGFAHSIFCTMTMEHTRRSRILADPNRGSQGMVRTVTNSGYLSIQYTTNCITIQYWYTAICVCYVKFRVHELEIL